MLYEILSNSGVIRVRGTGTANVRAVAQDIVVWLDCLQVRNIIWLSTGTLTKLELAAARFRSPALSGPPASIIIGDHKVSHFEVDLLICYVHGILRWQHVNAYHFPARLIHSDCR